MKKFLLAAALMFGLIIGLMTSQAEAIILTFKCNNCGAVLQTNGTHPDDCGYAYGCPRHSEGRHIWACRDIQR